MANNSLDTAQNFITSIRNSLYNIMSAVQVGQYDKSFTQSGLQFSMGRSVTMGATSSSNNFSELFPRNYNIGSTQPVANVIIKKRMFTTLAHDNDVKFLDLEERAFLRASKNLFQLKAFQIATYESLTKFEQVLQQNRTMYVPAILSTIQNAHAFGALTEDESSVMQSTLLQITQRDLAGDDTNFTTWFINQFDRDLANIGRGVGVIEFTNFTKFDAGNKINGEGSASVEFEDPYHVMMISNDDIESAIRAALFDDFSSTLLASLETDKLRTLSDNLKAQQVNTSNDIILEAQANAAIGTMQDVSKNIMRIQQASPETITFVRKKMRRFYLGKAAIQPSDGIHLYIRSDTIYENDQDPVGLPLGLDRYGVDEEILRQEMYVVMKDRDFDLNLYKTLRDKNAFSGASVFAGVVEKVSDSFADGAYTLSITARNNLWYLEQSFFNSQPALDQKQGFLYDPLTPYNYKFDDFGNIKSTDADGNPGKTLLQDSMDKIEQLNLKHESGDYRGIVVNADNIVGGSVPRTNIQQVEHFPGMSYKWKEGIAAFALVSSTSNQTGQFSNETAEVKNNAFGLLATSTIFDNMDVANVVSIMVTGKPHSLVNFINDSVTSSTLNTFLNDSSSAGNSFFDIISRQNKVFGNFQSLINGQSVSIDKIKKLVYKKSSFSQVDFKLSQLEDKILAAKQKLDSLSFNLTGSDSELLSKTRVGLQAAIDALTQEENILIAQFEKVSNDIKTFSNNQDALGFSSDPQEREEQIKDFQYQQLYAASRRIEDVRYNRDINYFIVGTEYDTDLDIQAFVLELRKGSFKYVDNQYDSVITKARDAAKIVDFEFFADSSGNIRFRPPQYNKVPLSIYYEMFRKRGQQGVELLPTFIQNLFSDNLISIREKIIQANWNMLIELGKSGDSSIVNALDASVSSGSSSGSVSSGGGNIGIVEFLGCVKGTTQSQAASGAVAGTGTNAATNTIVNDGNITDELIEFNSKDRIQIDRAAAKSSGITDNMLTIDMLNKIAVQYEKRFGGPHKVYNEEDVISTDDKAAITKRKLLFTNLRNLSSQRNSFIKSYLSQLNNLGLRDDLNGSKTDAPEQIREAVKDAVMIKQQKLSQEILQVVSTGNIQGYARPSISSEFANLVEDDSRNYIGRGSGRRFIIRDDSIISFRIDETQPEFCNISVTGQKNLIGSAPSLMDDKVFTASATDFDLWRQYGFKTSNGIRVPYLHDADTQCKPYAVFMLTRQRSKVMSGSITVIGNEYYQLGDVVYLPDRDMLFYVVGVNHSFSNGGDFNTTLNLEYGRPPGEYIPTPLDVIGKTLLKQNTSTLSVTRRQLIPDTFYYPLRPTPVIYMANASLDVVNGMKKMLNTDSNQAILIQALMNINLALEKSNAKLIISGFITGSKNDSGVNKSIDIVKQWFIAPKILNRGITDQVMVEFKGYSAIPSNKINIKVVDLKPKAKQNTKKEELKNNDIVSSLLSGTRAGTQSAIITNKDKNNNVGILNPCQEAYALISDANAATDQLPLIIEIGIFYGESS